MDRPGVRGGAIVHREERSDKLGQGGRLPAWLADGEREKPKGIAILQRYVWTKLRLLVP